MSLIVVTAGRFWKMLPAAARTFISRMTHDTFTVSVAAIISNPDGRVLLLDHVQRPRSGWGLPGGFIGRGEQPEAALRRELAEETGIEITNVELYSVATLNKHVEILFTARSDSEARVLSREITELGWFAADELPAEMNPGQRSLIRKVLLLDV